MPSSMIGASSSAVWCVGALALVGAHVAGRVGGVLSVGEVEARPDGQVRWCPPLVVVSAPLTTRCARP